MYRINIGGALAVMGAVMGIVGALIGVALFKGCEYVVDRVDVDVTWREP